MNKTAHKKCISLIAAILSLPLILTCAVSPSVQDEVSQPYFTGDGGRGIRLAVLEPGSVGLSVNEQWILSLIQSSLTGDFNKYSAITVIDRQNLEKILAEQTLSLSGNYSDDDYIRIGHLTNARLILTGTISRTANSYMLELSVSDAETGERKASYPPKPASAEALENLSAVREAAADLLGQLGVELTAAGLEELKSAVGAAQVRAETALAKGITAQRRGTEVAALSYYFQAAAIDPDLLEAANRSAIIQANIASGNIREDARNDIQWRREWMARLTETEEYFEEVFKNTALAYTLFYSTKLEQGTHDYKNETATLNIHTNLHASQSWAASVERALRTVYDELDATKRKEAWGLVNWPRQSIIGLNPFEKRNQSFSVVIELVNDREQVIGRQSFQADGTWEFIVNKRPEIAVSRDVKKIVNVTDIKINDITDNITIRIASVNGLDARIAAQTGILQIKALSGDEWKFNDSIIMVKGVITDYNGEGGDIVINTVWDDPVIVIGARAFRGRINTSVIIGNSVTPVGDEVLLEAYYGNRLTSVTIGNSVTSIGDEAFYSNRLTSATIGNNVTSIGREAFIYNSLTNIIIPDSVTYIGSDAFHWNHIKKISIGEGISIFSNTNNADSRYERFVDFYKGKGYRAGVYTYNGWGWRVVYR